VGSAKAELDALLAREELDSFVDVAYVAVPKFIQLKKTILMHGPACVTNADGSDMIEDCVNFGMSRRITLKDNVVMYSGYAGLLDRFVSKEYPLPFLAQLTFHAILYEEIGKRENHVDACRREIEGHAYLDEKERLEKRLLLAGGTVHDGFQTKSVRESNAKAALIAHELVLFPDTVDDAAAVAYHALPANSMWDSERWREAHRYDCDLERGERNTTLQEFDAPIPPEVFDETFRMPYAPPARLMHVTEAVDREGPRYTDNRHVLPTLCPPQQARDCVFPFREFTTERSMINNVPEVPTHDHAGQWYGPFVNGKPSGKGIAVFLLGPIADSIKKDPAYSGATGKEGDLLQFQGNLQDGVPNGYGDLMNLGRTLFSGLWRNGVTFGEGTHMRVPKGKSPRQLFAWFLSLHLWQCRYPTHEDNVLEIRFVDPTTHEWVHAEVDPQATTHVTTKRYFISAHVTRLARSKEWRKSQMWIRFDAGTYGRL
jgi:hypothetical protein